MIEQLRPLPDLIELYLWLDQHLAHLLTRERAEALTVGELFNRTRLRSRFETLRADSAMR